MQPTQNVPLKLNYSYAMHIAAFTRVVNAVVTHDGLDTEDQADCLADLCLDTDKARVDYFSSIVPRANFKAIRLTIAEAAQALQKEAEEVALLNIRDAMPLRQAAVGAFITGLDIDTTEIVKIIRKSSDT